MTGHEESPSVEDESLLRLARETGRFLGELGVRPEDDRWILAHASTLASLFRKERPRRVRWLYRLARRAARTAR
ncbi:MAG: hypothetical protein ABI682_03500 [Acidobacteriota bacterium]